MDVLHLLAATSAAAVLVATPVAASAETQIHKDNSRDVVRRGDHGQTPAPRHERADITTTVTRYSQHRVKIVVHVRDLRRVGDNFINAEIRTSAGGSYSAVLSRFEGGLAQFDLLDTDGASVPCGDASISFRSRKDLTSMRIPAGCLGTPAWMRIGIGQSWSSSNQSAPSFLDDSRRNGHFSAIKIAEGPRLHRG